MVLVVVLAGQPLADDDGLEATPGEGERGRPRVVLVEEDPPHGGQASRLAAGSIAYSGRP